MCLEEGVACVYPPGKPRQSKAAEATREAASEVPEPVDSEMANNEPDDLGSPGFQTASHVPATDEPEIQSVNGPAEQPAHNHFAGHGGAQVSEPSSHQIDSPSATFNQGHGIYQHPSGLTFPRVAATATPQPPPAQCPVGPYGAYPDGLHTVLTVRDSRNHIESLHIPSTPHDPSNHFGVYVHRATRTFSCTR